MIAEFEQRLASVLSGRLPAPFNGRAEVAPGPARPDDHPHVVVGVTRTERVEPELGARRPEVVPGANDPRRVLRLRCTVGVEVRPARGQGRPQQVRAVDAALYALDAGDLHDGSALPNVADPGFFIHELRVVESSTPLNPEAAGAPRVGMSLRAEGWFWPPGVAGQAGRAIGEIRLRGVAHPLTISPEPARAVAGGDPLPLAIRVGADNALRVNGGGAPLPFGRLALTLTDPDGGPPAGALAGGAAGDPGVRLVTLTGGEAAATYTPPAAPAVDELVVALDDGQGGLGVELGRTAIVVRSA